MADSKRSLTRAITTDPHFWVPIAVLIAGIGVLVLVR